MKHSFSFTAAGAFLQFLDQHRDQWFGQRICGYYCDAALDHYTKSPFVFVLENFQVIAEYRFHSDLTLHISPRQGEGQAGCPIPGLKAISFPYLGHRVESISLKRFSHCFEGSSLRPDGGDYFGFLTVTLDSGKHMYIGAADAQYGGYGRVWTDESGSAYMFISPPISQHAMDMQAIRRDFGEGFDFSPQTLAVTESSLHSYRSGRCIVSDGRFRDCDVQVYDSWRYSRVVILRRQIPTFDSADRQYDSWHALYLVRKRFGSIHAVYCSGGYRIGKIQGFAQVLAWPRELQPFFD